MLRGVLCEGNTQKSPSQTKQERVPRLAAPQVPHLPLKGPSAGSLPLKHSTLIKHPLSALIVHQGEQRPLQGLRAKEMDAFLYSCSAPQVVEDGARAAAQAALGLTFHVTGVPHRDARCLT